jgi:hypothetical protein
MEQIEQLNEKIKVMSLEIENLNQKFEDHFLSDEDKILIDEAMKEKEEGKLISMSDVF